LFGTAPVGLAAWLVVVPFAMVMLVLDETKKAIVRTRERLRVHYLGFLTGAPG
jgi:hypothetical protein